MGRTGVRLALALAATLALIPLATAGAAPKYPACWKGAAGCKHTLTRYFEVTSFTGSVVARGTKASALTCQDVGPGQAKSEIVGGTYKVSFVLDLGKSKLRIDTDKAG